MVPASKTDLFCQGVSLTILAACNKAYAVKSLRNFFKQFFKSHYHLLFFHLTGTFNCKYIVGKFQEGINRDCYERN